MSNPVDDPSKRELKPDEAKALFRDIVLNHDVSFTKHADVELDNDNMQTVDALNVLRAGEWFKTEFRHGEFRYTVGTPLMKVVVTPLSTTRLRVITGWREK